MTLRRWTPFAVAVLVAATFFEPASAQKPTEARRPAQAQKRPPQAPAPRKELAVPFAAGEKLSFDVSWSSYVTAGSATMTVVEKRSSYNSTAYYIAAEGQPVRLLSQLYDLYYKADTLLDTYSLLPQRASVFSREGRRQQMKVTMFDHRTNTASYEVQAPTGVKRRVRLAANSRDPLGAIYGMRARALVAGDRFPLPICDAGEAYTVQVAVAAPERVRSGIGEVRAWRITPTLPREQAGSVRRLTLWLSDDGRRVPVKMQAQLALGTFDFTLRSIGK